MDKMYKCLMQEVNDAQLELNIFSGIADSFFPENHRFEKLVEDAQ